jgi:DNA-binding transcriptional MerR regulator
LLTQQITITKLIKILNDEQIKLGNKPNLNRGIINYYCELGLLTAYSKNKNKGVRAWRKFDVEKTIREWRQIQKYKNQRFTLTEIKEAIKKNNLNANQTSLMSEFLKNCSPDKKNKESLLIN